MNEDKNDRTDRRFNIEVPVFASTVLEGQQAWIVDVSKQGVRLRGFEGAAPRMRMIMEYEGHPVCGTVRWAKPDGTVGVRLDTPLQEGPLAKIWGRFQQNVSSFGAHKSAAPRSFGKRAD